MAKLASAAEFNALVDSGKYENKVNAQRAAGRTRLPDAEKKKVFAYIEQAFPDDGTAPAKKPGKKAAKKTAKKAAKKVAAKAVATETATAPTAAAAAAPAPVAKPSKRLAKKASKRGKVRSTGAAKTPPGTLPLAPREVNTVADVLQTVDSTVQRSVSIINALKAADEISKSGDISKGIERIKLTLEGAANLLHDQVVMPLSNASNQADPEVIQRLEQVVAASQPNAAIIETTQIPPHQTSETVLS
jgi:hypothetical protein